MNGEFKLSDFENFEVEYTIDEDCMVDGYDGDSPLDPEKNWTCYVLFFYGDNRETGEREDLDCIGGVWASNDSDGERHIRDVAETYFLDDKPGSPKIEDISFSEVF